jgi:lipopolysaccharide/colanic/teichoic acid biosynthesis glycosyltransferase
MGTRSTSVADPGAPGSPAVSITGGVTSGRVTDPVGHGRAAGPRTVRQLPWRRSLSRALWRNVDELPGPAQMDRLIARETARAERTGQPFSLALFRVSEPANSSRAGGGGRIGPDDRRLALTLLRRARLTDEVGWFGDDHLCALLPDTSAGGAQIFAESVCDLVARKDPRPAAVVYTHPYDSDTTAENDAADAEVAEILERRERRLAEAAGREESHHNGNGKTNGNGHANGNGHVNGNRHAYVNGNGHANGNGLKHANGNGNGNVLHLVVDAAGPSAPSAETAAASPGATPASRPPVEPLTTLLERPMPWWKRVIDIVGAGLGLLILSPLLIAVAVAMKLTCPGPVIFKQRRAGLGGRPFTIYKFRTMCVDAEAKKDQLRPLNEQDGPAFKMEHDPRVTRLGRFLRKSSIDELPQLFNVLKGDMSLVGPRPLPVDESAACERWQKQRLDVTPGLTCIWQVAGRNQVTFAEWVRMDVAYMRRRTIFHDLSILIRTIPAVLLRRGAK